MARLSDPVTILKGVGPTKAKQFAALNIHTLRDLICHFPRGYEDRTKLTTIEKLRYNVSLRGLDWETGGVTNAQH